MSLHEQIAQIAGIDASDEDSIIDLVSEVMGEHNLSSEQWDALSDEQAIQMIKEFSAPVPVKVVVLAENSEGCPEFVMLTLPASRADRCSGKHYDKAIEAAEDEGYAGDMLAFDENDVAAKQVLALADFLRSSTSA